MILWRLRGYSDPESEFEGGEAVCGIERSEDGYRLLVQHNGEVMIHESHGSTHTARGKAQIIKETLIEQGWVESEQTETPD